MRKFKTEQESIEYFKSELEGRGFTHIVPTSKIDKFAYYDIDAEKDDKKYRFELKNRDLLSTTYNDAVIEVHKYNEFVSHKDEYDYGVLVSFFEDCFTLSDINKWFKTSVKMGTHTTDFDDKKMITKHFLHYHQHKKYQYK